MKHIILLKLFLLLSCGSKDNKFEDDNKIEFVTINKVPVVKGKLNNIPAYFIIDSGASLSVLDENQKDKYKFYTTSDNQSAVGYGGVASFKRVTNVDLFIGGKEFETNYKAQNLSSLVDVIREDSGYEIVGIIGSDIMKSNKFIINYSDNSISLSN